VPRALPSLAVLLLLAAAGVSCGGGGGDQVAGPQDLIHVHDLVLDSGGEVLAATHTGLYRIESLERAVLVGSEQHDLMSMAREESGALIASGHPDLRLEQYRVEDRPPLLGLIRSQDEGLTWDVLDKLGEADFHALSVTDVGIFGAESAGAIWLFRPGGSWERRGQMEASDLATAPGDARLQAATDFDGILWVSDDGGFSWHRAEDAPDMLEIEWTAPDLIIGIDDSGIVWSSATPAGPWESLAVGPPDPESFLVDGTGTWVVASHGGRITLSSDQGATWTDVYAPESDR
jgi:hypothetical protein